MIAVVAALKEEVADILKAGLFKPLDAPGEAAERPDLLDRARALGERLVQP